MLLLLGSSRVREHFTIYVISFMISGSFLDFSRIPRELRHEQLWSLRSLCVWLPVDDCFDTKQLNEQT